MCASSSLNVERVSMKENHGTISMTMVQSIGCYHHMWWIWIRIESGSPDESESAAMASDQLAAL